jgi:nicotinamide-nucleotide amidase
MQIINAEVITIGDEILYGQITDTNTQWISSEIDKIGIKTIRKTSIGDNKQEILDILNESLTRANVLLITGGLGPTKDDITKNAIAEFLNDKLVINEHAEAFVKDFFEKRGREFTEINRQQAALPSKCTYLHNATGTAPGMWFDVNGRIIVSMPGVPVEMKYLMTEEVIPRLKKYFETPIIVHRVIRTIGIGESFLAEKIETWEDSLPEQIKLAYLPSFGQVKLRLTGFGNNIEKLNEEIEIEVIKLKALIEEFIFSTQNEDLEQAIGTMLLNTKTTLGLAESCTGGHLSHIITAIAGSSAYYLGGVVSYSNEAKMNVLKVKQETLTNFGAVSEQTVCEMAEGVRKIMNSTYAIATSGIAGPGGGTPDKPVGTVWIAVTDGEKTIARKLTLGNQRVVNIQYSSWAALNLLRKFINKKIN